MILYIAEKPSLGRAVADGLGQAQKRKEGYIELANGDCVSWCIGHLLEQAEPEHYDPSFKKWQLSHLPIVPQQWQLKVKSGTRKQFSVLKKLVKQAEQLVHIGDPDREGQLLVDEAINHCKISKAKRDKVLRCLINDLTPAAVKKSLANLRPNTDFIALSTSALARARADWLYGLNMTRLCTLQGQQFGYQGVLSIGRVQTPVLGLVVARDLAIDNFVSKPFYQLDACIGLEASTPLEQTFKARWQPSEACQPYMDEDGRVLSKALVENVSRRIHQQAATVLAFKQQQKQQPPPLPYSLSSLQIDAAKIYGLSAKQVLDTAQQLYEQYQLITYPRSDCRYLPAVQFKQAGQVLAGLQTSVNALAQASPNKVTKALSKGLALHNSQLKSKAWNDQKVNAHHAIIPTTKTMSANLSRTAVQVYSLIARQYLMQFLPAMQYQERQIDCDIGGGLFIAKQRQTLQLGWKVLLSMDKAEPEASVPNLPEVKKGDVLFCQQAQLLEKETSPPAHFNDATLLAAMTGIARFVKDPQLRKILRDTDGIGTEATRAGIIELLFKRDYLERGQFQSGEAKGKTTRQIRSTELARKLIQALPEAISQADMTAHWEQQLNAISTKELSYQAFMAPLQQRLEQLIEHISTLKLVLPAQAKPAYKTKPKAKGSKFNAKVRAKGRGKAKAS